MHVTLEKLIPTALLFCKTFAVMKEFVLPICTLTAFCNIYCFIPNSALKY